MLKAVFTSFLALKERYFWKIALVCLIVTGGILGGFIAGVGAFLASTDLAGISFIGSLLAWIGTAGATFISYFLAPLLFPLISILFLEGIVTHVEQEHYQVTDSRPAKLSNTLPAALMFVGKSLVINLLALPFYFIPGIYYLVNGYLYGREYFEMIALRHHKGKEARALRRKNRWKVILAGIIIMVLFTVPFVNLLAPILATVFMVHVYHHLLRAG